jgi:DNA-binding NarL/FixJ family response regulator
MKVIVVDVHPLVRKGIKAILSEAFHDYDVREASCTEEYLELIKNEKFDLTIIDINLDNEDGVITVSKGKELNPSSKYIILATKLTNTEFQRTEKIGVDGYLLMDNFAEEIVFIVDTVIRGKKYYDPSIVNHFIRNKVNDSKVGKLTKREREVLVQLGYGHSNVDIANALFISVNTVKKHVSNILLKLEFEHRTQLALFTKSIEGKEMDAS